MREQKGITMVMLVVTIIVIIILAGVTTYTSTSILNRTKVNTQLAELSTIEHALLEKYTAYNLTKNKNILEISTRLTYQEVQDVVTQINTKVSTTKQITLMQTNYDGSEANYEITDFYYQVTPELLKNIEIENAVDTYIINYKTGEVINKTTLVTSDNNPLYISINT